MGRSKRRKTENGCGSYSTDAKSPEQLATEDACARRFDARGGRAEIGHSCRGEGGRGDAAAATWIFRGDASLRRRRRSGRGFRRRYYRAQLPALDDAEWARVSAAFKEPLPATFRVTGSAALATRIERELAEIAARCDAAAAAMREAGPTAEDVARHSRDADPERAAAAWHRKASSALNLRPVAWVPGRRAWRLDAERAALRKSPAHKELHTRFSVRNARFFFRGGAAAATRIIRGRGVAAAPRPSTTLRG